MSLRKLRNECEGILDGVPLPNPFSVEALCRAISEMRGRRLYLHVLTGQSGQGAACGAWIATEKADHIFYEPQTSEYHRDHIILHEIGHMLCGHDSPGARGGFNPDSLNGVLDINTAKKFLFRTDYTTREEQGAEMVATLIRERARTLLPAPTEPQDRWLRSALGVDDA
ncbi:hypothetical protein [Kutzneria sp. CA-103260]|uniref:hypothetical protein n=1 Tax=Kutzneria sp. CA-103260 TaxID=2802641 RepID=UPI001BAAFC42|nr:hypothetical protein [Kutzneria sp. CA-103260]QUQ70188.1 hypothetical protein JJ691_79630 [Kutzneria sp. CA-103260]